MTFSASISGHFEKKSQTESDDLVRPSLEMLAAVLRDAGSSGQIYFNGGRSPGPSIKNPKQYEALKREGYDKSSAAAISNSSFNKSGKKGKKRGKKR